MSEWQRRSITEADGSNSHNIDWYSGNKWIHSSIILFRYNGKTWVEKYDNKNAEYKYYVRPATQVEIALYHLTGEVPSE